MDNDDRPVGRILSRREILALFGIGGAALIVGCGGDDAPPAATATGTASQAATTTASPPASATASETATGSASASPATTASPTATTTVIPACIVSPELTEGPYFVEEMLDRSDIRSDPGTGAISQGAPLALAFNVYQAGSAGCTPLPGAMVDVWHCDAQGIYSDARDAGFNTIGQQFLRGYQVTDEAGHAAFTTIFPGWYQGRAVHIHFKVRGTREDGQSYEFTSQLFFDDAVADEIYTQDAYAGKGQRTLLNDGDSIYRESGGLTLLPISAQGEGYAGTFEIGLNLA